MKAWEIAYKVLPKTPYEGPPFPNGFEVNWPFKLRPKFPRFIGDFSVGASRVEDKVIKLLGAKEELSGWFTRR